MPNRQEHKNVSENFRSTDHVGLQIQAEVTVNGINKKLISYVNITTDMLSKDIFT